MPLLIEGQKGFRATITAGCGFLNAIHGLQMGAISHRDKGNRPDPVESLVKSATVIAQPNHG